MAPTAGFLDHLQELLEPLAPVTVRRMFGGAGIFAEGLMFGLVAQETFYLKADDSTRAMFEAEGMTPFTYDTAKGGRTVMSYWRVPDRLLEDSEELVGWARTALAVARRGAAKARTKPRPQSRR